MNNNRSIGFKIRTVSNLIRRHINKTDAHKEIDSVTGMHGWAIGFLCDNRDRDIFQRDFEEEFRIRRSTATRIMQLMETNGLITRESVDYDARLKKIVLTEKALSMHEKIVKNAEEMEEQLTKGLSREELDSFFTVMDKIIKNIGE